MEILHLLSLAHLPALTARQLAEIAPYASETVVPVGRRLLLDGPFAHELVLVGRGRGRVRCAGEPIGDIGPGDVLGVLAPRRTSYLTATVTVTSELRLVMLSTRDLRRLGASMPATAAALLAAVAPVQQPAAQARRLTLVPAVAA
ncbi:MAG: hypothetical protein Q8O56_16885 [Solirubrobacteraceae bacterium]|nr:hypothetical protein [Solirubrobacteraceae bacterium]